MTLKAYCDLIKEWAFKNAPLLINNGVLSEDSINKLKGKSIPFNLFKNLRSAYEKYRKQ